jgi:hypothetical protein
VGLLVTDELIAGLQIGDGDLVVVEGDGRVHRPVPPDASNIGHITRSLAGADAGRDVRSWVAAYDRVPPVLWVSTDGFGGAYESPDWFVEVGQQLAKERAEGGLDAIASKLHGWLAAPADVAGDDATMVVVLAAPIVRSAVADSPPAPQ